MMTYESSGPYLDIAHRHALRSLCNKSVGIFNRNNVQIETRTAKNYIEILL